MMDTLKSTSFKEKFPPLIVHTVYFLSAITFCFLYYLKVVKPANLFDYYSLNTVISFEATNPFQYRLFVPFIFKILFLVKFIPQKALFMAYSCVIVYFILIAYYYLISEYFKDKFTNFFLALFILYPMTWNYVLLNNTLQFYDFTAILFFIIGLYFIIKNRFNILLIVFLIGLLNKEAIVYLIFAYALFNYKSLFTRKIILNITILVLIFLTVKISLWYIFRTNLGAPVEICWWGNMEIISKLLSNRIYTKNVFFNFGGLYLFIIYFFISGGWKNYTSGSSNVSGSNYASGSNKAKLLINFTIVPFLILGFLVIYISEVRVHTEMMPLVTTLFLIYISTRIKLPDKNLYI